jgi:hypothetical protein
LAPSLDSAGMIIPTNDSPKLRISNLSVDYSTESDGNTMCIFSITGTSVAQNLGLVYTVYVDQIMVVSPTPINNNNQISSIDIILDADLGFVYNPWMTYTVQLVDNQGNVEISKWPLNL